MKDSHTSTSPTQNSILRRVGWQALCTLTLTMLANIAVVGFISFLWFADYDNTVWHKIMVQGWATRSVSISTLILRFAIDLQAGIAGAMLASIILESCSVSLRRSAQVSTMRANYPGPRTILDLVPAMSCSSYGMTSLRSIGSSILVLLLFATTSLLQFSSTALLSDLRLGQLPTLALNRTSTYDFIYQGHGQPFPVTNGYYGYTRGVTYPIRWRPSTWIRNPSMFPAFAEYAEPVSVPSNVDDMGVLLRAFLPFADAESRETIRNYSGTAMVLDSRVSCQSPDFLNITVRTPFADFTTGRMTGNMRGLVQPSVVDIPRLWTDKAMPFDCSPYVNAASTTICQIGLPSTSYQSWAKSGALLSEFWNISSGATEQALRNGLSLGALPMLVIRSQSSPILGGARLNQPVTKLKSEGVWTAVSTPSLNWSISLCFSAWDTADLEVDIYSDRNRTEPILHWSNTTDYYTTPNVHDQMGETNADGSPESRGILQLSKKTSWIPPWNNAIPCTVKPFVKEFADLSVGGNLQQEAPLACSPCSALLLPPDSPTLQIGYNRTTVFAVDYTISSLFRQTLGQNGTGSVARAMSTLITMLSSMAYYDQMPQFEKSADATQTYFTSVLFPRSHLGFWALMVVLASHVGLVFLITLGFVLSSQHTLLGNHWQSIAQLLGPETRDLLAKTRETTDSEVKTALAAVGNENSMVEIKAIEDGHSARLRLVAHSWDDDGHVK